MVMTDIFRMLYEFYTQENKKEHGRIHATYLIYGTQSAKTYNANDNVQQDGEDISMTSSPYMSSSMPQDESILEAPPVKVMTLVQEENLEGIVSAKCLVLRRRKSEAFDSCEGSV